MATRAAGLAQGSGEELEHRVGRRLQWAAARWLVVADREHDLVADLTAAGGVAP
jgi:hypothetical protein